MAKRKHTTRMLLNNQNIWIGCGGSVLLGCFLWLVIKSWQNNYKSYHLFGFTTYTTELKEPPGLYSLTTVIKAWKL